MALNIPTQIGINFRAQLAPNGDEGGGKIGEILVDLLLGNGVGANQADGMFFDERSLAGGANEDIDLQTIVDGNGVALGAAEIVVLIIQTPASNTGTIELNDSAANPWISWLNSAVGQDATLDFLPGTTNVLVCTAAAAYAVAGGNKTMNFLNLEGGATNVYTLAILTRSA